MLGDDAIERATAVLQTFDDRYGRAWREGMRAKLGLAEADAAFFDETLALLQAQRVDYTSFFRALPDAALGDNTRARACSPTRRRSTHGRTRGGRGRRQSALAAMNAVNPIYIPRNHLVEEALTAATNDDLLPLGRLMEVLARPFEEREGREPYAAARAGPLQRRLPDVLRHLRIGTKLVQLRLVP